MSLVHTVFALGHYIVPRVVNLSHCWDRAMEYVEALAEYTVVLGDRQVNETPPCWKIMY